MPHAGVKVLRWCGRCAHRGRADAVDDGDEASGAIDDAEAHDVRTGVRAGGDGHAHPEAAGPARELVRRTKDAVTVGREFDMAVVATGIETPADAQRARAFGVGWGEGGLFGSPQPLTAQLAVPRPESLL